MWYWRHSSERNYLKPNRLSDVLALIQVLALDRHSHRSETGLQDELQGPPRSGADWASLAYEHAEFFRVSKGDSPTISLVARHVTPRNEQEIRVLSPDYAARLLQLAVELHDREMRRAQSWHVYIPLVVAITAGLFTVFGVVLKSWLDAEARPTTHLAAPK